MYRSEVKTVEGAIKFAKGFIKTKTSASMTCEVFNTLVNEIERLQKENASLDWEVESLSKQLLS